MNSVRRSILVAVLFTGQSSIAGLKDTVEKKKLAWSDRSVCLNLRLSFFYLLYNLKCSLEDRNDHFGMAWIFQLPLLEFLEHRHWHVA